MIRKLPIAQSALSHATPGQYWEARAQRFAHDGEGLAAVCSYGMPTFYNRYIQLTQRLALGHWLRTPPGATALDVGCGVGRWSRLLARRGAIVKGIDLSATMIEEAKRRAQHDGVAARCSFAVQDLAHLDAGGKYDLMVGVTVLQHILDDAVLARAIDRMAFHLAPSGRMVLLEAAPTSRIERCDSAIFTARDSGTYIAAFERAGLRVEAVTGVDPMPFKTQFLPYYACLPRPLAWLGMLLVTAVSLPFDALLGRRLARASWHKVFVLRHARR